MLGETLHADVVVVRGSCDPALKDQIPLARHPPRLNGQTLVPEVTLDKSHSFRIVDGAVQYVLQYVSRKVLPLARDDCRQGTIWEGIEIDVTETASTSRVKCLLLFLSGPCCQKIKVKLPAIVGIESIHLGDRINVLFSPTEQFVIERMWSEEAHEVTIECCNLRVGLATGASS